MDNLSFSPPNPTNQQLAAFIFSHIPEEREGKPTGYTLFTHSEKDGQAISIAYGFKVCGDGSVALESVTWGGVAPLLAEKASG